MKFRSQEQLLSTIFIVHYLALMSLLLVGVWYASSNSLYMITVFMVFTPAYYFFCDYVIEHFFAPYRAMQTSLDAIRFADTSIITMPIYEKGITAQLHQELRYISNVFGQWHTEQNRHALLVTELLQALDSPILIVDQDFKLILGNTALSQWLNLDWRLKKFTALCDLGFKQKDNQWGFELQSVAAAHQLRTSEISLSGTRHYLLLISDIKRELKQSQNDAWRQLVKVLSHEIKNSLTPIKSIAQTLMAFSNDDSHKQMLEVIVDRSQHLHQFVSNYASLEKALSIQKRNVDLGLLCKRVIALYADVKIELIAPNIEWDVDPVLLEQVIINLLKNAIESCEAANVVAQIKIEIKALTTGVSLEILDNGIGLTTQEHLFVPFFTTKENGQGIGLVWCQKVIELHNGTLTLSSGENTGAIAKISLE